MNAKELISKVKNESMMYRVPWLNYYYPRLLNDPHYIPPVLDSVLDVGCCRGTTGALLRNHRTVGRIYGLDIFEPYLQHANRMGIYDKLFHYDLRQEPPLPFKDEYFDLAICLETVEHLPHDCALRVIAALPKVAARVVITTPTKYTPHIAMDGNENQKHRSLVTKADFRDQGYKVRGLSRHAIPHISWRWESVFPRLTPTMVAVYDGSD